jgi:excisionase family DNA binding protein
MELIVTNKLELRNLLEELLTEKLTLLPNRPTTPTDDRLLSPKEAAEFLRVSLSTIHNRKTAGKLAFYRIGGKIGFTKSDLMATCTRVQVLPANC